MILCSDVPKSLQAKSCAPQRTDLTLGILKISVRYSAFEKIWNITEQL